MAHQLRFRRLSGPYVVVRFAPDEAAPSWAAAGEFTSVSRSSDELSIVCPAGNLPHEIEAKLHWICLKLEGPFAFSLTGVLLAFIEPLSSKGIPIVAVSTYDTDYVLIQEEWIGAALNALRQAGHELV
ncbi:MAG TPA: ACT domain-containing protein [Candidatus Eisenbacteria bacterium]|nr:ACT domain-containing protein [Candidatus Eisenbacteria bacterium]